MTGAVKAFADVAEIYWKFVGDEWSVRSEQVKVTLLLPEPGAEPPERRIWAHGPLNGVIRATGPTEIVAEVDSLDPHTFVEVRALFPPDLIPGAGRINSMRLDQVLEEERGFSEASNRIRNRARTSIGLSLALPILGLAVFFYLFFRYGKEYRPEVPEYYHDLPTDQPPAVVGYLYRFGKSSVNDVTATFLDLARRGHLRITQRVEDRLLRDKTVHEFQRLTPRHQDQLAPFEEELLSWALDEVGDGRTVTDEQLSENAKKKPKEFLSWHLKWRKLVKGEADKSGWLEPGSVAKAWINGATGAALVLSGIALRCRYGSNIWCTRSRSGSPTKL